ncbi:MAG: DUF2092 domain-containing protein [Candidatus Tritonobacter lacicola]|nr:DUF2092 domain-containing protein [Candidatus Tritonobacter lacicola]
MVRQTISLCALTGLLVVAGGGVSEPAATVIDKAEPVARDGVEPKANEILYRACTYLQQAKTFQFQADVTRDVILYDGVRVQYGGVSKVTVQRPNKLRAIFNGDERSRRSYFDGEILTIYSLTRNNYAQAKIPGTIDEAIDHVFETFGFSVPLADLVYADPYSVLIENVNEGHFIGRHKIDGVVCDHLAFQQELIDWQIWIETDKTPLVRKVVITYKTEEGCPEYEAVLSHWKLNPSVRDADFEFTPPADVAKIEFLPCDEGSGEEEESQAVGAEEAEAK